MQRIQRLALMSLSLFLCSTVSARQISDEPRLASGDTFSQLTLSDLRQIVDEATEDGSVPVPLSFYPKGMKVGASGTFRAGDDSRSDRLEVTCRTARGRFVVLERSDAGYQDGRIVDVIGFDSQKQLYRRWRWTPDANGSIIEMVGITDTDSASLARKNYTQSITISWTQIASSSTVVQRSLVATEWMAQKAGSQQTFYQWTLASIKDKQPVYRERIRFAGGANASTPAENTLAFDNGSRLNRKLEPLGKTSRRKDAKLNKIPQSSSSSTVGSSVLKGLRSIFGAEDSSNDTRSYRIPEFNFRMNSPGKRFAKVDPKAFNQEAALVLMQQKPFQMVMVIAEKFPDNRGMRIDQLLAISRANMQSVEPGTVLGEVETLAIDGLSCKRFTSIKRGGKGIGRSIVVAVHGSYGYQIMTATQGNDDGEAKKLSDQVMSHFSLIDKSAPQRDARLDYAARELGVTASFGETDADWQAVDLYPSATFAVAYPDGCELIVVPVDLGELEVEDEILNFVLASAVGIEYPDGVQSSQLYRDDEVFGTQIKSVSMGSTGKPVTSILRVIRHSEVAVAVAAFGYGKGRETDELLEKRIDLVALEAPQPIEERLNLQQDDRRDDELLNQIGVQYYAKANFEQAIAFFKEAQRIRPDESLYVQNVVDAFIEQGKMDLALANLVGEHRRNFR